MTKDKCACTDIANVIPVECYVVVVEILSLLGRFPYSLWRSPSVSGEEVTRGQASKVV